MTGYSVTAFKNTKKEKKKEKKKRKGGNELGHHQTVHIRSENHPVLNVFAALSWKIHVPV